MSRGFSQFNSYLIGIFGQQIRTARMRINDKYIYVYGIYIYYIYISAIWDIILKETS